MKSKLMVGVFSTLFLPTFVLSMDNIQFRGELIIPNCVVNDSTNLLVDWGEIEIQTFTNKNIAYYIKQVPIKLDCPYYYNTPKLTVRGDIGEGKNYLQTSKHQEGLVISVRQGEWRNGNIVALGEKLQIASDAISGDGQNKTLNLGFALTRIKDIEDLKPGQFTASANLEVFYE
ncbi:TPA: fimbrial protein [Escherichia coli]|uniref:fimbrial protein n=1 Tax=Escherichia coli TaxID=562 RepID=UPI00131011A6|nr:fimbrial protein [Escherichia coli]EJH7256463.1 fimbrial protein [Escherichia coli]EJI1742665.1 fimbrial protein [Escherichia coli]MWM58923.1 fimbrial protein [Escherichia coli]HAW1878466.1 fimbrial protein [Escherichia coli]HAW7962773.1 fimbrial protein [Escherichia coli]